MVGFAPVRCRRLFRTCCRTLCCTRCPGRQLHHFEIVWKLATIFGNNYFHFVWQLAKFSTTTSLILFGSCDAPGPCRTLSHTSPLEPWCTLAQWLPRIGPVNEEDDDLYVSISLSAKFGNNWAASGLSAHCLCSGGLVLVCIFIARPRATIAASSGLRSDLVRTKKQLRSWAEGWRRGRAH